ncbi:unnamed protein product [Symbiodinium natans]|uniref:Uncharacterized protein n=1 Tax=Symbiodinium natans TaxID=878477 RepID=A0A812KXN7_9DINO|nr:unnamed protein product [Symbiodinium natans]
MAEGHVAWPFLSFSMGTCLPEASSEPALRQWRCKRLAEESSSWAAAKRRKHTADGGHWKDGLKPQEAERSDELKTGLAAFGAFGESCVADLSAVTFLTLTALVAAGVFILICISSSLVLAVLCSCVCLLLSMLALSNHVLFMTYEGAWAV